MKAGPRQAGLTLVVSLIMLIVLTLLVVSAIRFGNINVRIAGNAQTEAEAVAAAQVAVERTIQLVIDAAKVDDVPAQPALVVPTGGASYTVSVAKPSCLATRNIPNSELDPARAEDVYCYSSPTQLPILDADGNPVTTSTACKNQQWDIAASVDDAATGARVTIAQGVAMRVGAAVQCP